MKKWINLAIILLASNLAFAHGEDKAGPNGGFVRMPGAFHTEVIPVGKNKVKVYLLDIDWKNPSVLKSNLQVRHNDKIKADCAIKENYYICEFPKSVNLFKKGELKVLAQREDQKGAEVSYKLPLNLKSSANEHGSHH